MENKTAIIDINNTESKLSNVSTSTTAEISRRLSVQVPNYWFSEKYKSGQWDGYYKFFSRPSNKFPTGLLPEVVKILEELKTPYSIQDNRKDIDRYKLSTVDENYKICDFKDSRGYQIETINKVITNTIGGIPFMRGVINIATNGGKTTIAEGVMKELYPKLVKYDTIFLFVTHSKEIANQAKKSIETDLGIPVGFIGDGKWDVKNVTVAIVTTLYSRRQKPEFKEIKNKVVGFIADEAHHSSSTSWYDTLQLFTNASIRLGLTGTIDNSKPINEMKLYSITGGVLNRVSNDYLIENGYSAKPICILFQVNEPEIGKLDYRDAYNMGIIANPIRTKYITQICKKEYENGNVTLVLVEYLNHGQIIYDELEKLGIRVHFTNGTLQSDERQYLLDSLKDNKIDVLISTAILDEGVDVSNINAVIYARGMKSMRKLLQGLGRGLRKKSDGSKLRFYDFIDDTHTQLLEHSYFRYKILKQEKFTIKTYDIDEYVKIDLNSIEEKE